MELPPELRINPETVISAVDTTIGGLGLSYIAGRRVNGDGWYIQIGIVPEGSSFPGRGENPEDPVYVGGPVYKREKSGELTQLAPTGAAWGKHYPRRGLRSRTGEVLV